MLFLLRRLACFYVARLNKFLRGDKVFAQVIGLFFERRRFLFARLKLFLCCQKSAFKCFDARGLCCILGVRPGEFFLNKFEFTGDPFDFHVAFCHDFPHGFLFEFQYGQSFLKEKSLFLSLI